jgi:hypothetical protein
MVLNLVTCVVKATEARRFGSREYQFGNYELDNVNKLDLTRYPNIFRGQERGEGRLDGGIQKN